MRIQYHGLEIGGYPKIWVFLPCGLDSWQTLESTTRPEGECFL